MGDNTRGSETPRFQVDARATNDHLYDVTRTCADANHKDSKIFASTSYCAMVMNLKKQFIPDVAIPAYRVNGSAARHLFKVPGTSHPILSG
jgi:hypothetical protein